MLIIDNLFKCVSAYAVKFDSINQVLINPNRLIELVIFIHDLICIDI